jgi:hypothetical protein
MDFLSTLHADVRMLLVAAALALLAGLVSGTKRKEQRYIAICALLLVVAGVRHYQQEKQDLKAATRISVPAAR